MSENPIIKGLRAFFNSVYYVAFTVIITALANLFSLELPVYYVYLLTVILTALFADDTSPFIPMAVCGYMSVSPPNNPATYADTVFASPTWRIQVTVIASVIAAFVIARLAFDLFILKEKGGRGKRLPSLTYGFIFLGAAFILGGLFGRRFDLAAGVGTGDGVYGLKTAFYGAVQALCMSFFYFYFYFTVDWKKLPVNYYGKLFTAVGWLMAAEIARMYFNDGVFTVNGVVRSKLLQGWGVYNNVGCVMAMMIPAPFSMAKGSARKWAYVLTGIVFYAFMLLTNSRGAMLFGTVIFAACLIVFFIKSPRKTRVIGGFAIACAAVAAIAAGLIFKDKLRYVFSGAISVGLNDGGRLSIYLDGLKQFIHNPIFGNGFYECASLPYGNMPPFIPSRYHNTVVQLLASCGAVGLIAYALHRIQTIILMVKKPVGKKLFIALSIAALLLTSLTDCNLFNLGPGIIYSVLLALAEGNSLAADEPAAA